MLSWLDLSLLAGEFISSYYHHRLYQPLSSPGEIPPELQQSQHLFTHFPLAPIERRTSQQRANQVSTPKSEAALPDSGDIVARALAVLAEEVDAWQSRQSTPREELPS